MPVSIIVGGQFGAEGKGKVSHLLAKEMGAGVVVRVGGTNSGHSVASPGDRLILRQLPTAAVLPDVVCVLGPGCYIDPEVLMREIEATGLGPDRLLVDPAATIISETERRLEAEGNLRGEIGSTLSGTGAAVLRRVRRTDDCCLARHSAPLQPYLRSTVAFLRDELARRCRVIIEGTQGFGLSLLHSPYYPYATSRDTTAAAFAAEAGISPLEVDDVILVIRAFPIRVGGNSGPLPNEIDWETVTRESGGKQALLEHTSVTKTLRRVARFDPEIVRTAICVNRPTRIVLNHVDYIDPECADSSALTAKASAFVRACEEALGASIDYCGTGPATWVPMKSEELKCSDSSKVSLSFGRIFDRSY